jgi:nucleotide-binding universal stress UspA family protein
MRSALLGSVALHCAVAARCPVVIVRGPTDRTDAGPAAAQAPRIVIGMDGSPESKEALSAALVEAAATGAALEVVTAYSPTEYWTDFAGETQPTLDVFRARVRERLDAAVDKVRADLPSAVRSRLSGVRTVILDGRPTEMLVERAQGAQLLVVGDQGRGALRGLLLGSVALGCVLHAECPVMVVHHRAVRSGNGSTTGDQRSPA